MMAPRGAELSSLLLSSSGAGVLQVGEPSAEVMRSDTFDERPLTSVTNTGAEGHISIFHDSVPAEHSRVKCWPEGTVLRSLTESPTMPVRLPYSPESLREDVQLGYKTSAFQDTHPESTETV